MVNIVDFKNKESTAIAIFEKYSTECRKLTKHSNDYTH